MAGLNPTQRKSMQPHQAIDAALNEAGKAAIGPKPVSGKGPGYKEQIQIERKHGNLHGGVEVVAHQLLHHAAEHSSKALLGALGMVAFSAVGMVQAWVSSNEKGEKLREAMVRDAFSMTVVLMADEAKVLPRGYTEARAKELPNASKKTLDAIRLMGEKNLGKQGLKGLRVAIRNEVKAGLEYGMAFELKSQDDLKARLEKDPSFKKKHDENIAFREGVLASIWMAENQPQQWGQERRLMETDPRRSSLLAG